MKPWQPWAPLMAVGALGLLALVAAAAVPAAGDWLDRWLWRPIVEDAGYNPVNTTLLVLLGVAGCAWLALLFRHYGEDVDLRVALAGLLFFAGGVTLRVFEDADLFAPFADDAARAGAAPNASCLPDAGSLGECAGVLFVTPLLWMWLAPLVWALARAGLHVQWLGDAKGQAAAQWRARVVVAAVWLLAVAPWLLRPTWMAAVPHPLGPTVAALAAAAWLARRPRLHWTHLLAAGSVVLLGASASLLVAWFYGEGPWGPAGPTRPSLLLAAALAVAAVLVARRRAATSLAGPPSTVSDTDRPAGKAPWLLLYLDLAALGLAFAALAGFALWRDGQASALAWWPIVLIPLVPLAARSWSRRWHDARLAFHASGVGLFMLGGQAADALVTAVGIDVLGAGEKHVVPRLLIEALRRSAMPEPFASYAAATVLVPLKVGLVALASWFVGIRAAQWWPGAVALRRLVLLAVGMLAAAPALRNALRMAMGV